MIRKPCVAGQFYPPKFKELENLIIKCFKHRLGPGDLPISKRNKNLKAVIVPHASFSFSGPCAAWGYKEIAESKFPDTYIILSPNHTGTGKTSTTSHDWETPFGIVKSNKELIKQIVSSTEIVDDINPHLYDHATEVQLPFLQFVSKEHLQNLKIVPISIRNDINFKDLALNLKEVLMDYGKPVTFIISSDLTHYGPAFHYLPFELNKKESLNELDNKIINLIKKGDPEKLYDFFEETGATVCGIFPLILILNLIKFSEGTLLQYYTSGDLTNNYKNSVGYASLILR
jgi:MEMO1 family protein